MATLTSELRTYLLADTAIAAAVGTRIRPRKLQQGETYPAIRVNIVGGTSEEHLLGASGLAHTTVQIDAYALTSEAADELAELIRLRLQGHRGLLSTVFANGISVASELRQHDEPIPDGSGNYRYISSRDFRVSYSQAVPS